MSGAKIRILIAVAIATALATGVAAAAIPPGVRTAPALPLPPNGAVLLGVINPRGASTTYYFQWGLTSAYTKSGKPLSAGSGIKPVLVHQIAIGLRSSTTYHYRLVASNELGTTFGADRTFTTAKPIPPPPLASTGVATSLSKNGATINGTINPEGRPTKWYFQWGATTKYGQQTTSRTLAAGTTSTKVSSSFAGLLAPGTIYHYRLVASHTLFTSYGSDQSFMTYPSPRPVPHLSAKTKPKHDHKRPYVFTTSGKLVPPPSIPPQYACAGTMTIRFFRGSRQVAHKRVGVQPNCAFSSRTMFRHLPGHRKHHQPIHLRVVIRFLATPYLASNKTVEHVTVG